jgi:hypothetical protein
MKRKIIRKLKNEFIENKKILIIHFLNVEADTKLLGMSRWTNISHPLANISTKLGNLQTFSTWTLEIWFSECLPCPLWIMLSLLILFPFKKFSFQHWMFFYTDIFFNNAGLTSNEAHSFWGTKSVLRSHMWWSWNSWYCNLQSASTLTRKLIICFKRINSFFNLNLFIYLFLHLLWYCDRMSEII